MVRQEGVPILGGVENMSGLVCPHCGETVTVFPAVREERSIWALGVERLGSVPLDPAVAEAGDSGRPLLVSEPRGVQADAFRGIAVKVAEALASRPAASGSAGAL
jgi:ATP-binding protein involved in chromosome partitioning